MAREAAQLLYSGSVKEYKQAKEEAARRLGLDAVPSNFDVALELDLLAEETERDRSAFLIHAREQGLRLMGHLAEFGPRLIGSVWRGTARRGSDIDISVYAQDSDHVLKKLEGASLVVDRVEESVSPERGGMRRSRHIIIRLEDGMEAEVAVRPPGEQDLVERCDIYGDPKRGLSLGELERLMKRDPLRRFVPRRRRR